ncbi:MAG: hypothetical protein LUH08_00975 [Ruminococcus sp.]|nr:hypothetical protein [Ruminococcus sp.]MCD7772616.1 hypothetical protein [Ruminococcus sp.]
MLEIKVAEDREKYFEELSKFGLDEDLTLVVESYDKGEVNGYGFYHLEGDSVSIDYIESYQDLILFDGIVRSILFKAMLSGIDKAVFSDVQLGKFQMLGFVQNNYKTLDSIGDFLSKCKSCGK